MARPVTNTSARRRVSPEVRLIGRRRDLDFARGAGVRGGALLDSTTIGVEIGTQQALRGLT